jgi:hypothetical protein
MNDVEKKVLAEKNINIPNAQIETDILDTQREIDIYQKEKDVLMNNPRENRTRIYLLEGRISQRQRFIEKLNAIIEYRE